MRQILVNVAFDAHLKIRMSRYVVRFVHSQNEVEKSEFWGWYEKVITVIQHGENTDKPSG